MKRLILAALLLLAIPGVAATSTSSSKPADSGVRWQAWDAGLSEAGKTQRPVLVDVYTDWCGWCKRMDRDVYSRPEVRKYLANRFITVRLNAESNDAARYEGRSWTSRSLASRFEVSGYPTTIFLRANGEHLANLPGYIEADRFLLLLRYVGEGAMDRGVSFEDFSKDAGAAAH